MLPFKQLPPEIRLIIYNLDGVLLRQSNGRPLALLRALRPDHTLYQEAKLQFYRTNVMFMVADTKVRKLESQNNIEPKHVKHILIAAAKEWPSTITYAEFGDQAFSYTAKRLAHYPMLQTLIISDSPPNKWEHSLKRNRFLWGHLPPILELSGSMFHLRRIVIQIRGLRSLDPEPTLYTIWGIRDFRKCWNLVDKLSVSLGVLAKLERVSPTDQAEDWFWEAGKGDYFKFENLNRQERKQRRRELGWSEPPR